MNTDIQNNEWLSIIGRSLAFLCIHSTDLKDKGMTEQANFLKGLGMSYADIAALLSTSESSIRGLISHRGKSKNKKTKIKKGGTVDD
jgi:hypothetical protein